MRIVDESLLDEFRTRGRCDVCGLFCAMREPHHILPKGMGGGGQMDVRINLLAVGYSLPCPGECKCHDRCQRRKISLKKQCEIVGRREGLSGDVVLERLYFLRRLPNGSEIPEWVRRMM